MRKRKGKKKNCSLYKSEANRYKIKCGHMLRLWQCWEKCHIFKKDMDEFMCFSCSEAVVPRCSAKKMFLKGQRKTLNITLNIHRKAPVLEVV